MALTFQKGNGENIYISKLTNNDTSPLYKLSVNDILRWKGYLRMYKSSDETCVLRVVEEAKDYLPSVLEIPSMWEDKKVVEFYRSQSGWTDIKNVKRVIIPDSVVKILWYAFQYYRNLEDIVIGKGVKNIGDFAFSYCESLNKVYYKGTESEWNSINIPNLNYNSNKYLLNATRYYYSDTKPTTSGNYWHEVDGEIFEWDGSSCENGHIWKETPCTPKTCTVCGETRGEAKYPHTLTAWKIEREATCKEFARSSRHCIICGSEEILDGTEYAPHKYSTIIVPPTCTEKGYTSKRCSVCDDEIIEAYTDMLSHNWGEWNITLEPTCTACGEKRSYCSNCGEYNAEIIAALGHDYGDWVFDEETQLHRRTCSRCGQIVTVLNDELLGHDYEVVESVARDCGNDGYITYTCSRCGDTFTEILPKYGRCSYEITTIFPTCEDSGYQLYVCKNCNNSYTANFKEALGHNSSDWIIDVYPTMLTEGSKHKECTRCGEILETATIPMLTTYWDYTLLDDGTYSVKPLAYVQLSDTVDIPSEYNGIAVTRIEDSAFEGLGDITFVNIPSSITHIGAYAFQDCRGLTEITIPTGVIYVGRQAFYEAGVDGITIYCEATSQPSGWHSEWADSAGSAGSGNTVVWTLDCNYAHDWDVDVTVVEPTCTDGGYTIHTCKKCDETYYDNLTDPLGHNIVDGACTRCGYVDKMLIYYGVSTVSASYNTSLILGLEHKIPSDSHLDSITVEPLANEYIFYCAPTSYGECAFAFNNFIGGFSLVVEGISVMLADGTIESYNIYKSNQANLGANGEITISIIGTGG